MLFFLREETSEDGSEGNCDGRGSSEDRKKEATIVEAEFGGRIESEGGRAGQRQGKGKT